MRNINKSYIELAVFDLCLQLIVLCGQFGSCLSKSWGYYTTFETLKN